MVKKGSDEFNKFKVEKYRRRLKGGDDCAITSELESLAEIKEYDVETFDQLAIVRKTFPLLSRILNENE